MTEFKLPSSLRRHFVNLSVTIQQLIGEIVLTVEGMPSSDNRALDAKLEQAARARRANEKFGEQLKDFLACHTLSPTDAAIACATLNGRTTRQIAEFIGVEFEYAMRRLMHIRKLVAKWHPVEEIEPREGADVLELFAEAQRR